MDHDQLLRLRQNRRQVAQPELISRPDDYLFQLRERHGDGLYPPAARRVIVTENKVNGLALPELADTLAIFGLGYGIQMLAEVPWLKDKTLYYWGDIDTHGLNILAMVRGMYPHARAQLMDQATLLQHRDLWSSEETPHPQISDRLTAAERDLCKGLLEQRWGRNVRLEQERIPFGTVRAALAQALS